MALGVAGTRVGIWTADEGHTGCTVILPPAGKSYRVLIKAERRAVCAALARR